MALESHRRCRECRNHRERRAPGGDRPQCMPRNSRANPAMAVNLWLDLHHTRGDWPWTHFLLVVVQSMFVIEGAGRSLGADALMTAIWIPWHPECRRHAFDLT